GVVQQETALVAAEPGVPAQETDAPGGQVVGDVVFGEVDLVVGGDHRDLRFAAHPAVVQTLAGMPARPGATCGGGVHADELAGDSRRPGCAGVSGHGGPPSCEALVRGRTPARARRPRAAGGCSRGAMVSVGSSDSIEWI